MPTSSKKQRNVLLDPADDQMLVEFCRITKRDIPETMRHIFKLFFQNGMKAASDRLNAGLWDLPDAASPPIGVRGDSPKGRAAWVVDGESSTKGDGSIEKLA